MSMLLPCPFCGGEGKVKRVTIGETSAWMPFAKHLNGCPMDCMTHDGVTAFITREHAIDAWNTRHRETCEMVPSGTPCEGYTDKCCTACGAYNIGEYYDGLDHAALPKFCPECGARVKAVKR